MGVFFLISEVSSSPLQLNTHKHTHTTLLNQLENFLKKRDFSHLIEDHLASFQPNKNNIFTHQIMMMFCNFVPALLDINKLGGGGGCFSFFLFCFKLSLWLQSEMVWLPINLTFTVQFCLPVGTTFLEEMRAGWFSSQAGVLSHL